VGGGRRVFHELYWDIKGLGGGRKQDLHEVGRVSKNNYVDQGRGMSQGDCHEHRKGGVCWAYEGGENVEKYIVPQRVAHKREYDFTIGGGINRQVTEEGEKESSG